SSGRSGLRRSPKHHLRTTAAVERPPAPGLRLRHRRAARLLLESTAAAGGAGAVARGGGLLGRVVLGGAAAAVCAPVEHAVQLAAAVDAARGLLLAAG